VLRAPGSKYLGDNGGVKMITKKGDLRDDKRSKRTSKIKN